MAHATDERLEYTHIWRVGDMMLWDNRCAMHYRELLTTLSPGVMHRTQIQNQALIGA